MRILIIRDPMEGVALSDILQFRALLSNFVQTDRVAIINTPSEALNRMLASQYVFFRQGNVVRKVAASTLEANTNLARNLFGPQEGDERASLLGVNVGAQNRAFTYTATGINVGNEKGLHLHLQSGQIVTIVAPVQRKKIDMFELLSGRVTRKGTSFWINDRRIKSNTVTEFARLENRFIRGYRNR